MLRITRTSGNGGAEHLTLEGRLAGEWVPELRAAAEPLLARSGKLVVDLTGVAFVDPTGVGLLQDLVAAGAALHGASAFVAELLGGPRR
ncbi:MAG: STAS domain-containing protein [Acidobacteria bacterium]|nr:STAS domain-containing protein [Acidobacteriota bacterium]